MSARLISMLDVDYRVAEDASLFIYCLTKEARGTHILSKIGSSARGKWAIRQSENGSSECAMDSESDVIDADSLAFSLQTWVDSCTISNPSIALDISCMSRPTMAAAFQAIFEAAKHKPIKLTTIYVLSEFTAPPHRLPPNEDIKPISDWFAGWPSEATASTALVVGLGYEHDKAVGACEYFDAGDTWVFNPKSPIPQYDEQVMLNNQELLARGSRRGRVIPYRVDRPAETFGQLVTTVSRILPKVNPVLLPFGPKIFFALNLLVAAMYKEVGVWHVTGDVSPSDVLYTPTDFIPAFQIDLAPEK